ncbi:hypothetical protein GEMRC1_010821 [Eukaryota sp. GEM-RC1]
MGWLVDRVETSVETNVLLAKVFEFNNFQYIQNRISQSDLSCFLDHKFKKSLESKISKSIPEVYECFYSHWNPCTSCLLSAMSIEPSSSMSKPDRNAIKTAFNMFNQNFEEKCFATVVPFIVDDSVRKTLGSKVMVNVRDCFAKFLKRYEGSGFSQNKSKYFKYSVEAIGESIRKYFKMQ